MASIETAHRALIVIDVQNDYDGGNMAIEHPPFAETVKNIASAMDAATAAGIKVAVVRNIAPANASFMRPGTHGAEYHPMIATRHRDHYVEKTLPSAFAGTNLELWLRQNRIETITVAGYMTHNCDLATILHAVHAGFDVEFLSDAAGSVPYSNSAGAVTAEELHRVIGIVLQSRFAAVLGTQEWIGHIKAGSAPARDTIHASNQRALAERRPAA